MTCWQRLRQRCSPTTLCTSAKSRTPDLNTSTELMLFYKLEYCNVYTLRNYFYIDMDPLHPMSFWRLVARLDMDIYPQTKCYGSAVWLKLPSPVWTNKIKQKDGQTQQEFSLYLLLTNEVISEWKGNIEKNYQLNMDFPAEVIWWRFSIIIQLMIYLQEFIRMWYKLQFISFHEEI